MRSQKSVLIAGLAVLVLFLALGAAPVLAADNSFTTGSDWNTGTNWSLGHVPLATEDVKIITGGANPTLSNSGANGVAKSVTIGASNTVIVNSRTLSVGPGASSIAGSFQIQSGGIVALTGAPPVTNAGGPASPAVVFNNGTGFLDVNSGGSLDM